MSHLMCFYSVCPRPCLESTQSSTYHYCNPPALVISLTGVVDPPPLIKLDNSVEWEVNWILDSKVDRCRKGLGLLYLVEWKGFDNTPDETSWEPPDNLGNASDFVQAFHVSYMDKPSP